MLQPADMSLQSVIYVIQMNGSVSVMTVME